MVGVERDQQRTQLGLKVLPPTWEVSEYQCLSDLVDVAVERRIGLVLEPRYVLRQHLAIPFETHRDPVVMGTVDMDTAIACRSGKF